MKKLWVMQGVLIVMLIPSAAFAEGAAAVGEAYTWQYLGTIAGATTATLLIVQYTKVQLDRVWKIPTRLYVYGIAAAILLVAAGFTGGLTVESALLALMNAVMVSMSAYGGYELTFGKSE